MYCFPTFVNRCLAAIPWFVEGVPGFVTVELSLSRFQKWLFAALLAKSSEKSSRFHENSLVDIVNIVQGFPADFTTSLFTRENEPLIGAHHVLAAMAAPSTVISKV